MIVEQLLFVVLIVAFGVLAFGHKGENKRHYRIFLFAFLVSILYGSVYMYMVNYAPLYAQYADYLVFVLILTSLAVMTQYLHHRAVERGTAKATKKIVDVAKDYDLEKMKKEQQQK